MNSNVIYKVYDGNLCHHYNLFYEVLRSRRQGRHRSASVGMMPHRLTNTEAENSLIILCYPHEL